MVLIDYVFAVKQTMKISHSRCGAPHSDRSFKKRYGMTIVLVFLQNPTTEVILHVAKNFLSSSGKRRQADAVASQINYALNYLGNS